MIMDTLLVRLGHFFVADTAAVSCGNGADCGTGLPKISGSASNLHAALATVFAILGVLSVIVVVIGGFQLIMSQGDPQQVGRARMTIIYAVIGLAVAVSAEAIVGFVLGKF